MDFLKKMIFAERSRIVIAFLWIAFALSFWVTQHIDRTVGDGVFNPGVYYPVLSGEEFYSRLAFFLSIVSAALIIYLWLRVWRRDDGLSLKLSYWWITCIAFVFAVFAFDATAFLRSIPGTDTPMADSRQWIPANIHFVERAGAAVFWIFVFALGVFLLGGTTRRFLRKFLPSGDDSLYDVLVTFTLGLFGWSIIAFLLASARQLSALPIGIVFFAVLAVEYRFSVGFIRGFFRIREWEVSLRKLSTALVLLVSFVVILNFVDALRPVPTGFDDTTQYLLRTKTLVETHALDSGGYPFPFELLVSLGWIIGRSVSFAIGTTFLFFLLGFLAVYGFAKRFFGKESGLLAAALCFSLPMASYFVYREAKPELLLFFVSVMSIWSLFLWLGKTNIRYFFLSMFFLGFAVSVKLTGLFLAASFLAASFLAVLLLSWRRLGGSLLVRGKTLLFGALLFLLPLSVWMIYGGYTREWRVLPTDSPVSIFTSVDKGQFQMTKDKLTALGVDHDVCKSTYAEEDYSNFLGVNAGIHERLALPWVISMNTLFPSFVMEIGFMFLVVLPLFALFRWKILFEPTEIKTSTRIWKYLFVVAGAYWLLWGMFAHGIPWYGFPGFVFLSLLVASFIRVAPQRYYFRFVLLVLSFLSVFVLTALRAEYFGDPWFVRYIVGGSDPVLERNYFSHMYQVGRIINEHPSDKVLVTASTLPYFVDDERRRVLRDWHLDEFICIDQGKDDMRTLARLRSLGIRYIFFQKAIITDSGDTSIGYLREKVGRFVDFSSKNLKVVVDDRQENTMLFEVPPEGKQ